MEIPNPSQTHRDGLDRFEGFLEERFDFVKSRFRPKGVDQREMRHPPPDVAVVLFPDRLDGPPYRSGRNEDHRRAMGFMISIFRLAGAHPVIRLPSAYPSIL